MRRTVGLYAALVVILVLAGSAATLARYGSLHPCSWLRIDASRESDLPDSLVDARLRAIFLLRGIASPGPSDCITEWWRVRRRGLPDDRTTEG